MAATPAHAKMPTWKEASTSWPNFSRPSEEELDIIDKHVGVKYGPPVFVASLKKEENGKGRFLIVSQFYWMVSKRKGSKSLQSVVEKHMHELASVNLEGLGGNKILLGYKEKKDKNYQLETADEPSARGIINVLLRAHAMLTHGWPASESLKSNVLPDGEKFNLPAADVPQFGGFILSFQAYLVELGLPVPTTEACVTAINKGLGSEDRSRQSSPPAVEKILHLNSLPHVTEAKDKTKAIQPAIGAAMSALRYNTYFKGLLVHDLIGDNIPAIVGVAAGLNTTLTSLVLEDLTSSGSAAVSLGKAIESNAGSQLTVLSLANVEVGNTGAKAIAAGLRHLHLQYLSLAGCEISSKGLGEVFNALANSADSIHTVDLSLNEFSSSGTKELVTWLGTSHPQLRHLFLSRSSLDLNAALKAFPPSGLATLDLSVNVFSAKQYPLLKQALLGMTALAHLNLRATKINGAGVIALFEALIESPQRTPVTLDFGETQVGNDMVAICDFLFTNRCEALQGLLLSEVHCKPAHLTMLAGVLPSLPNLTTLNLSQNIKDQKKEVDEAINKLTENLSGTSKVHTLVMSGSEGLPLGRLVGLLAKRLVETNNSVLQTLDVSHNRCEEEGFLELANLLKANRIRVLKADANGLTRDGLEALISAAETSTVVQQIEIKQDLAAVATVVKKAAKRKEDGAATMQALLTRFNNATAKNGPAGGNAQGVELAELGDDEDEPTGLVRQNSNANLAHGAAQAAAGGSELKTEDEGGSESSTTSSSDSSDMEDNKEKPAAGVRPAPGPAPAGGAGAGAAVVATPVKGTPAQGAVAVKVVAGQPVVSAQRVVVASGGAPPAYDPAAVAAAVTRQAVGPINA